MKPKILVVDDEKDICRALAFLLSGEGYAITQVYSGEEALEKLRKELFDIVITDLKMERVDGIAVLEKAKELSSDTSVVIMTAFASVESAVETMKKGASDYIVKPFLNEEIRITIRRILEQRRLVQENMALRQQLSQHMGSTNFVTNSEAMLSVINTLEKVIPTKSNILILGESGTGKGLVAEVVHGNSPRRDRPFITINCSAIPEGLLESELFGYKKGAFTGAVADKAGLITMADQGTLFLDEIGDMPLNLQTKLLKVLESSEVTPLGDTRSRIVDVRLITATNQDLEEKIRNKTFREDLYYRLNVIEVKIPPLRERKEDIHMLTNYFVKRFSAENKKTVKRVDDNAMSTIVRYGWPGNVRELRNVIERAVVLCPGEVITTAELPDKVRRSGVPADDRHDSSSLRLSVSEYEKTLITNVYQTHNRNKEETAKALGVDLATLYRKLKKHGIED
ncbi:MAG TPA: sigma-54 dependent transcriptional regulator [Thermodesulfovibrionales bacterium]|nr:sigma-54 dependent transcriptional regulator [Thermodesulfovibrionales bacterium]